MKSKVYKLMIVSLLVIPMFATSCMEDVILGINGEGEVVSREVQIDDITGFANSISADVYVSYGETQEFVFEAHENIFDNMDFDWVRNGVWTIRYYHWVKRSKPVKIFITLPRLETVVISGSGNIIGENYFDHLDALELVISGSGSMDLEFNCTRLDLTVTGSGDFTLNGQADELNGVISGSGDIDAFGLETIETEFRISGSGNCWLSVADRLSATISGSGSIFYRGDPVTNIHILGSGDVRRDQ